MTIVLAAAWLSSAFFHVEYCPSWGNYAQLDAGALAIVMHDESAAGAPDSSPRSPGWYARPRPHPELRWLPDLSVDSTALLVSVPLYLPLLASGATTLAAWRRGR